MWLDLGAALALVLVIEGMLPFINPSATKKSLTHMLEMSDRAMRFMGFLSMLSGVILLYIIR